MTLCACLGEHSFTAISNQPSGTGVPSKLSFCNHASAGKASMSYRMSLLMRRGRSCSMLRCGAW